jgi:cytochrome c oxidase assembly protein subunit 15
VRCYNPRALERAVVIPSADNRLFTLLARLALVLVLIVVVLSAYIRLRQFGLGCADWPSCYGDLQRIGAEAGGASLSPRTAVGVAHRIVATVLGLLLLGMAVLAWLGRPRSARWPALALLALTVFLSALGYATPTPLHPAVTMGNLLGGLAMLALLWVLAFPRLRAAPGPGWPLRLFAAAVVVQLLLGGWVSANFAAPACGALPECHGQWWPHGASWDAFDPTRRLALGDDGRVQPGPDGELIHMLHRYAGVVLLLLAAVAAWRWREARRSLRAGLLLLVAAQATLGAALVGFGYPLALATAHNAGAALILIAAVSIFRATRDTTP